MAGDSISLLISRPEFGFKDLNQEFRLKLGIDRSMMIYLHDI